MRSTYFWRGAFVLVMLTGLTWYGAHTVSAAAVEQADRSRLKITIVGRPDDSRIAPVREALAHWNSELARLGRTVRLDSATILNDSVPDETLRAASNSVILGFGPAASRLRASLSRVPGDIVIVLSNADLISFALNDPRYQGIVVIRRSDIFPLSLPNTLRNVVAHELGHALGLKHNADSTTLMCGRPASCRPALFASDSAHFFPLTKSDEELLRQRWR